MRGSLVHAWVRVDMSGFWTMQVGAWNLPQASVTFALGPRTSCETGLSEPERVVLNRSGSFWKSTTGTMEFQKKGSGTM